MKTFVVITDTDLYAVAADDEAEARSVLGHALAAELDRDCKIAEVPTLAHGQTRHLLSLRGWLAAS